MIVLSSSDSGSGKEEIIWDERNPYDVCKRWSFGAVWGNFLNCQGMHDVVQMWVARWKPNLSTGFASSCFQGAGNVCMAGLNNKSYITAIKKSHKCTSDCTVGGWSKRSWEKRIQYQYTELSPVQTLTNYKFLILQEWTREATYCEMCKQLTVPRWLSNDVTYNTLRV